MSGAPPERIHERLIRLADRAVALVAVMGLSACNAVVDDPPMCPEQNTRELRPLAANWDEHGILLELATTPVVTLREVQVATAEPGDFGLDASFDASTDPATVRVEVRDNRIWPDELDLVLEFTCADDEGATRYELFLELMTRVPATSGGVGYTVIIPL